MTARWKVRVGNRWVFGNARPLFLVTRTPHWEGDSSDVRAHYDGMEFRELPEAFTAASVAATADRADEHEADLEADMMRGYHAYPVGRAITEEALLAYDQRPPFGDRPVLPCEFMRAIELHEVSLMGPCPRDDCPLKADPGAVSCSYCGTCRLAATDPYAEISRQGICTTCIPPLPVRMIEPGVYEAHAHRMFWNGVVNS